MVPLISTGTQKKVCYIIYFLNRVNIYEYLPLIKILNIKLSFSGKTRLHNLKNAISLKFKTDTHETIFVFLYILYIPVYTEVIIQHIYKLYIPYILESFFISNNYPVTSRGV
jgi:hypothetical protein